MEDTDDYFSLKWNNFHSSLSEGFHDFLKEEAMVDVTLAAEGKFVQAHKLVLSVCSPYFKNLFKVNPCKHPIVILKDVGNSDLLYMLDFMYKGEVGVKHEDLPSFLKLAETLKIKGLAGEKIQRSENLTKNMDSNIARVRKKISKVYTSDVNQEKSEYQLSNEQSRKRLLKNKKRRLLCKSEPLKKLKSEKSDDNSANKCESVTSDNVSEEEDNNPLIKFIGGNNVKNSEVLKQSESQYDNESESQCDNKTNFSVWSNGVPDSEDSGGPDINSFFQSDCSEETEQTPQDNNGLSLFSQIKRANPVWDYFHLEGDKAVCNICQKRLAYKNHMYLTSLSNHLASKRHGHHEHYLEWHSSGQPWLLIAHKEPRHGQNVFFFGKFDGAFNRGSSYRIGNDLSGGVDYQMIQTKRGRDMLLFGGYTFTQNRMCKDGMRWQCSYPKCKAFCRMSSAGWLTPYKTNHDHPKPSEQEIKKRILRMELKARAQSSGATPGEILRNALPAEEFHSTDRACFTRCIQRFRKSLQRKNSKAHEEVWQTPGGTIHTEKDSLKPQSPTNGEPSWLADPRPLLSVTDPPKPNAWHPHQDPTVVHKQEQLLDEKGIIQEKMDSFRI